MRWVATACAAALIVAGCTTAGDDVAAPRTAAPGQAPTASPQLPAAEPAGPTLADFRREAAAACAEAADQLSRAPLRGDPLAPQARPRDVRAAVARYQVAAQEWDRVADRLWDHGLPPRAAAQRLVAALDTLSQHSREAAELLNSGDRDAAQQGVGAAADALVEVNRLAARLELDPFDDCGSHRRRLRGARRVRVSAHDHFFAVGEVRRGRTRFVLRNEGREPHQLFVVRLRPGASVAAAVAADREGGAPGQFLAGQGDTSRIARAGERVTLDVRLRPGRYALLCFVASPDGTPHAYKGMATEVTVPETP